MTRSRPRSSHLDVVTLLDYLDHQLVAGRRRAVDEHLGRPCEACRERVRALGELLETMRRDESGEVPAWLHKRALAAFSAAEQPAVARRLLDSFARLVFDSLTMPVTAAARRSVGEARRLRFELGEYALDLEIEREGVSTVALRGRLAAPDPALWTVEVRTAGERRATSPDADGAFSFENFPATPLDLHLAGPAGRFRLPAIEA